MKDFLMGKCKKHGELTEDNSVICKDSTLLKGYRRRCSICRFENRVVSYYKNREENIKKANDWKKNNRDRVNERTRNNRLKDILGYNEIKHEKDL